MQKNAHYCLLIRSSTYEMDYFRRKKFIESNDDDTNEFLSASILIKWDILREKKNKLIIGVDDIQRQ